MKPLDYKKTYQTYYLPKTEPSILQLPEMKFVCVSGTGNPNMEGSSYQKAMQILYGISFTIKMSKRGEHQIQGYIDYVVPPLEGLWWMSDTCEIDMTQKDQFHWWSMIRLPDFVDEQVFHWAHDTFLAKHPEADLSTTTYEVFTEGLCAQIMHKGPYDEEPATIQKLQDFIKEQGYLCDYDSTCSTGQLRKHHEIYLGDPRRTKPENLRTVIRLPIR